MNPLFKPKMTHRLFQGYDKERVIKPENFSDLPDLSSNVPHKVMVTSEMREPEALGKILRGETTGHFYSRYRQPNADELERLLVLAEADHAQDQIAACTFPSGMAASATVIDVLARGQKGKRFVRGDPVFIGSKGKLDTQIGLPENLESTLVVDTTNPKEVERILKERNGEVIALFFETITNPTVRYTNIREVAKIAEAYKVITVVDNTFLTPALLRPLQMGADVVVHSLTKYIAGHGRKLGGAVISYNEFINGEGGVRAYRSMTGAPLDSFSSHEIAQGMKGLPSRMERHCINAKQVADALQKHPKVEQVFYPDAEVKGQTKGDYAGGVVSIVLSGNNDAERIAADRKMIDHIVRNAAHVHYKVSLGEPETMVIGEYSLGIPEEKIRATGVPPGLIRIAVGREKNIGDTIAEISQAIDAAYK